MKITHNGDLSQTLLVILFNLIRTSYQTATYSCNTTVSCGCSTNSAVLSRIVGGEAASPATWSWTVSLNIANIYLCGGSLISASWVITAAHCVNGQTASSITIYAGSNSRWTGTQSRIVSKIIVHPSYSSITYVNDIALLQLQTPLDMTDPHVSQICLPSVDSTTLSTTEWPAANTTVVAVGWGILSEVGSYPIDLQQVTLQTISRQDLTCSPLITDWHVQLCAGVSAGGKDTCQGDSGGPLMMFTSSNQWVIVGLTSNGLGCAEAAYSGIYTRVATFVSWINTNTNGDILSVVTPTSLNNVTTSNQAIISSYANIIEILICNIFIFIILDLHYASYI
ncbi:unnamed protein product [Adineta steineri]|uniref:Peptidase S1 domain-containing protein n=1 Tax=Adineta steineri TaxID=433720 RepID=A0A815D5P0_9BILA|nr:unnamed protein product [Adineta steineri]CAF3928083.1 unnamed protein product [Adineta steineri]